MVEKDIGFVLRRYNFKESSLIVSAYTLNFGKVNMIFKGFYKIKKEFTSALDLFTLNEFIFYPKKNTLWLCSFVDLLKDYEYLRRDFSKARIVSIFFNFIEKCMELWDRNFSVFYLLKNCLDILDDKNQEKLLYIFLIKFLSFSGLKPEFNLCIKCRNKLEDEIFFSTSKGGFLCKNCKVTTKDIFRLNKTIFLVLRYIQNNDFPEILRLNIDRQTKRTVFDLLRNFIMYHLNYDILKNYPLYGYVDFKI